MVGAAQIERACLRRAVLSQYGSQIGPVYVIQPMMVPHPAAESPSAASLLVSLPSMRMRSTAEALEALLEFSSESDMVLKSELLRLC